MSESLIAGEKLDFLFEFFTSSTEHFVFLIIFVQYEEKRKNKNKIKEHPEVVL